LQRTQELDPAGDVVYDRIWFSWPLVFKASNNPSFSNPRKNSSHPIVIIHQCNFAIISTIAVKVNQHNYNQRIATPLSAGIMHLTILTYGYRMKANVQYRIKSLDPILY
jgi:hypothetical protein